MTINTAPQFARLPIREAADETVRRTIRALIKGRGLNIPDVADAVGMDRATFYRRLGGWGETQTFRVGEVATLAAHLGVSVEVIFTGMGGTFVPPTDDEGRLLPRQDSDLQPSGYCSEGVEPTPGNVIPLRRSA